MNPVDAKKLKNMKKETSRVCVVPIVGVVETKQEWTLFLNVVSYRRVSRLIAELRCRGQALPRVRTGLLMWLGGLVPCVLTALTTNWYFVSGNSPFRIMEFVSMGSRM